MAIILPNLAASRIEFLTVCAHADAVPDSVWGKENLEVEITTAVDGIDHRLEMAIHRNKSNKPHIHIDLALPSAFVDGPSDQQKGSLEIASDALSKFEGLSVSCMIVGRCRFPLESVAQASSLIRGVTAISTTIGHTNLSIEGAEIRLSGAVDGRMRWSVRRSEVYLSMTVEETQTIDDAYLQNSLKAVEQCICTYALEG